MRDAKYRYADHKKGAKGRGIEFLFTFDEWYNWWLSNGVDKNYAGKNNKDQLCMCRINDSGPYSVDNVYCDTRQNNINYARSLKHWNNLSRKTVTPITSPRGLGYTHGAKLNTPKGIFSNRKDAIKALGIPLSTLRELQINNPSEYYWEKNLELA